MKKTLFLVCALITAQQRPAKRELTVDWIMQGPALYGWAPQDVRWSQDSAQVFFRWKKHDAPLLAEPDTWSVNRDGSGLRKLPDEEAKQAPPIAGELSPDRSATVFVEDGDVFLYDHTDRKRIPLVATRDVESNAHFHRDARHVVFQRGSNLYLLSLDTGATEQLTDIQPHDAPKPPSERKGTDSQELLKKEERALLTVIEERAKLREEKEAKKKAESPRKTVYLERTQRVDTLRLSPDGDWIIARFVTPAEKNKKTIVPNYVTESVYTEDIPARDKVGDETEKVAVALIARRTGERKNLETKRIPAQPNCFEPGGPCAIRLRSADNKDEEIARIDLASGLLQPIVTLHDDAWLRPATFGWLSESAIWYVSEQTGYAHLYSIAVSGGQPKALTAGPWEIRDVELSADRRVFYLTSAEAGAAESHVYAMAAEGGDRKRLTTVPGGHDVVVSPDGTLADIASYATRPPELYLQGKAVTQSPAPDFASYPWIDPPIVEIPARDGVKVPARMYKPQGFKKGGPLVIFVHGAGYLQNAHKRWSQYSREYLFHHLLMDRGYMVLDIDYRGSAGYGRDWRTAIYRHMGGKDLDDQVDAVKWAVANHGVDPKRVGIYGGSYGGFITLMALFTQPDVFAAGAALRPVTDWAHYNQGYTSNILNLPQGDAEAYRRSSPIYFANGLKGALLIAHGMVDVNVHYQDSVRLVQKLIELRKENWEFASYPVEDHGFVQPTSWADEYKRILKLFESNLKR
jgi:dipeptidyl aminopeptidase/acylaminoacyl peptidase